MIKKIINKHLIPANDFIFGSADLKGLLNKRYIPFNYGISIGKRLNDNIINELNNGPTLAYYHHYNNINSELIQISNKIERSLASINIESLAILPTITVSAKEYERYLKDLTYDISHKMVATRAGLGWIGKTDLLISKKFGPRLRLVTILTKDDPGLGAPPINSSKCGKCKICVEKCPAQASNGKLWNISIHRDEFFNAHKCREMCGKLAKQKLNVDERICGLCVSVCPVGISHP